MRKELAAVVALFPPQVKTDCVTGSWDVYPFLLPADGGPGRASGPAGQGDGVIQDHIQGGRMRLDHWEL